MVVLREDHVDETSDVFALVVGWYDDDVFQSTIIYVAKIRFLKRVSVVQQADLRFFTPSLTRYG
jgi:hypothetical protein